MEKNDAIADVFGRLMSFTDLILTGVDEVVTVGLLLKCHIPWCFILGRRAAISQQKTALNSDPSQDRPINTSCPGDGQTQKLWHIQPSSSVVLALGWWHRAAAIIRAVINSCQRHRNKKGTTVPIHPAKHPHVVWANTRHTQVIDFNSSCNLLNGQKKVSRSLHTLTC